MTPRQKGFVIQAEFFVCQADTLGEIQREAFARALDGDSIKAVVRFFESSNKILQTVLKLNSNKDALMHMMRIWEQAGYFERKSLDFRDRWRRRSSNRLGPKLSLLVKEALARELRDGEVAVEKADFSFRLVQRDEKLELQHKVEKSSVAPWVFVFPPGDLLAERPQSSIAHFM